MLAIRSTAIDLGSFFTITTGEQECYCGSKFGFSLLLGDLNIRGIELTVAVGLDRTKDITNYLFLPVNQFKGFIVPSAFCMFEIFYESDRKICLLFAVAGALGKESCGFVFFEFANKRSPPPRDKKKAPKGLGYFAVVK